MKNKIQENSFFGRNVIYKEEMNSTNVEAKRQAEAGAPEGTTIIAERQLAGKGRRGRTWDSLKKQASGCPFYCVRSWSRRKPLV